ncbi:putative repeat protein (TIGR02543 family), partial [Aneurinibacillus soli]
AFNFSTTITGDTTLYAKWTSNDYTVTFNSNGGSAVTSQTVAHGNQASKPTDPTKAGNTFGGWYSDAGLTNAFNFSTTITGDTTLYAKWTSNDYTVTFNSNGGSAVTSQTVAHGNQASKPTDPTKAGNTFGGWYSDAGLTNAFNFSTTITGDTTLYAKWTANSYTVTFNSNGGSAVTNQTVVHEGTASEPTAPTKTGYTFGGWYSDAGLTNAFNFSTTITEDTTLYGKWTANSYTVMFNSNGGSAVTSQTVAHGNQASKPTDPTKAGYTFGGWYSDAGLTNAFSFSTTITGDTTLYAKWTSNDYTVTFNSNGGSTVANQTVAHGGTASEPTAPTKAGNTFGGWYSDAGLTNAFAFTTVITENTTLYAKWTTSITAVTSIVLDKPSLNLKVGGATGTLMATVLPADATNKQVTWSSSNESVATVDANGVVTPKAAGTTTITVKTVDGNKTATCLVTVQPASSGGSGGSSTPAQPSTPSTPSAPTTGVEVLVNGKVENAGIATASKVNDQTVTTIAVDPKKLDAKLEAEGQHAVITIPVKTNSDILVGELTGQMVKNMEQKQAVVEIKTEKASYTLPAQQINIDAVSEQIGKSVNLQDIKVKIEISKPTAETAKIVENSAAKGEFTIVAPPVNFTVKGTYGDKTINVSKFNAYVERTIAIPDGIDPNKITTGVVVDPDGTARHVPTKIVVIDGKYFAKINSLTNSTYSVVWHPLEFKDVEKHWAKNAVNDMGSRMVISGVGHDLFNPDQDITRAEFAAIMVRGLGIKQEDGVAPFADVKAADWYSGAVQTAYKYNLIRGFTDGTFRPNDKITREQAMAIIAKAMKITDLQAKLQPKEAGELLLPFIDAKQASEWAKEGVADCVQSGLVSGRNGQQLAPKEFISRAEVAAIVQRLLQKSELI